MSSCSRKVEYPTTLQVQRIAQMLFDLSEIHHVFYFSQDKEITNLFSMATSSPNSCLKRHKTTLKFLIKDTLFIVPPPSPKKIR